MNDERMSLMDRVLLLFFVTASGLFIGLVIAAIASVALG